MMVLSAFTVTIQVPLPEQPSPLQPENPSPAAAKVTVAPLLKGAVHVAPQLMPAIFVDVTVPTPVPANTTLSMGKLKFAVMLVLPVSVNVQAPVALPQLADTLPVPLVQLVKFEALLGVGVIEIDVPTA
jgi:hypothetical protein